MLTTALVAAIAVAVGLFIGAVGVGGILLIPALTYLGAVPIHTATATALFTFAFTGVLGTLLFQRRGSIDWRLTVPVCAGAVIASFLGAWAKSLIDPRPLALLIAAIIVFSGVWILRPAAASATQRGADTPGAKGLLTLIGAAAGFGSGLSGAGGPLFSVPMMVLAGFAPLAAVGTSQVLQIVAAIFGTAGNLAYGTVDFALAGWLTLCELAGVLVGVRLAHAVSPDTLKRMAALLCIVAGAFMLWRNL